MDTLDLDAAPLTARHADARRSGWSFVGAFLAFVAFVATIVIGDAERQEAMDDAANRLDLNINDLPAATLVPLLREYPTPVPVVVLLIVLSAVSAGCLIAAVRFAVRLTGDGDRVRPRAAVLCTWLAAPTFPMLVIGEAVIARTDVGSWFSDMFVALQVPAANYWAGAAAAVALILVSLSLRSRGAAPRMSGFTLALSALVLVAALFGGTPPIAPLLCGMLLGIALIRTTRRQSA